jgi:hypothetical protein
VQKPRSLDKFKAVLGKLQPGICHGMADALGKAIMAIKGLRNRSSVARRRRKACCVRSHTTLTIFTYFYYEAMSLYNRNM